MSKVLTTTLSIPAETDIDWEDVRSLANAYNIPLETFILRGVVGYYKESLQHLAESDISRLRRVQQNTKPTRRM